MLDPHCRAKTWVLLVTPCENGTATCTQVGAQCLSYGVLGLSAHLWIVFCFFLVEEEYLRIPESMGLSGYVVLLAVLRLSCSTKPPIAYTHFFFFLCNCGNSYRKGGTGRKND